EISFESSNAVRGKDLSVYSLVIESLILVSSSWLSSPRVPLNPERYSSTILNKFQSFPQMTEMSGIKDLSFKIAASETSNFSSRGLNAILIFSLEKSSLMTSIPLITEYRDVSLCCPSTINKFVVFDFLSTRIAHVASVEEFLQKSKYPTEYPLYTE